MKTIRTQRLYLQLAGSTSQGKTLELLAADEVGEVDDKAIIFMRYIRKAIEDGTFIKSN